MCFRVALFFGNNLSNFSIVDYKNADEVQSIFFFQFSFARNGSNSFSCTLHKLIMVMVGHKSPKRRWANAENDLPKVRNRDRKKFPVLNLFCDLSGIAMRTTVGRTHVATSALPSSARPSPERPPNLRSDRSTPGGELKQPIWMHSCPSVRATLPQREPSFERRQ